MDWLDIVLGSSAILGAIAAIWQWLTHNYLPARQAAREKQSEFIRQSQTDQQEFLQTTQSDALKAVLSVNETLVNHLIGLSNGQFLSITSEIGIIRKNYRSDMDIFRAEISTELSKLRSEVQPQLRVLGDIKAQMSVISRDWSRVEEIVSDIDQVLHKLEIALKIKELDE